MDDPALVGGLDPSSQQFDQFRGLAGRQAVAGQPCGQAAPIHVFQCQEREALMRTDFVDLHDMRMTEPCGGLGFGAEARALRWGRMDPGQNDLQGHNPIQADLPGLIWYAPSVPEMVAARLTLSPVAVR